MKETRDEGPKEEIYTKLAARSENTYENRKDGRNDQDACSRNAGKLESEIPSAIRARGAVWACAGGSTSATSG